MGCSPTYKHIGRNLSAFLYVFVAVVFLLPSSPHAGETNQQQPHCENYIFTHEFEVNYSVGSRIAAPAIFDNLAIFPVKENQWSAFDFTTGKPIWSVDLPEEIYFRPVVRKELLYFIGFNIYVVDSRSGELLRTILTYVSSNVRFDFSPNMRYLAVWGTNGTDKLIDLDKGEVISSRIGDINDTIEWVKLTSDTIFTFTVDGSIQLYDLKSMQSISEEENTFIRPMKDYESLPVTHDLESTWSNYVKWITESKGPPLLFGDTIYYGDRYLDAMSISSGESFRIAPAQGKYDNFWNMERIRFLPTEQEENMLSVCVHEADTESGIYFKPITTGNYLLGSYIGHRDYPDTEFEVFSHSAFSSDKLIITHTKYNDSSFRLYVKFEPDKLSDELLFSRLENEPDSMKVMIAKELLEKVSDPEKIKHIYEILEAALVGTGDFQGAIDIYKKHIELEYDPQERVSILYETGKILVFRMREPDEAIELAEKLLSECGDIIEYPAGFYQILSAAYLLKGDIFKSYEYAAQINGDTIPQIQDTDSIYWDDGIIPSSFTTKYSMEESKVQVARLVESRFAAQLYNLEQEEKKRWIQAYVDLAGERAADVLDNMLHDIDAPDYDFIVSAIEEATGKPVLKYFTDMIENTNSGYTKAEFIRLYSNHVKKTFLDNSSSGKSHFIAYITSVSAPPLKKQLNRWMFNNDIRVASEAAVSYYRVYGRKPVFTPPESKLTEVDPYENIVVNPDNVNATDEAVRELCNISWDRYFNSSDKNKFFSKFEEIGPDAYQIIRDKYFYSYKTVCSNSQEKFLLRKLLINAMAISDPIRAAAFIEPDMILDNMQFEKHILSLLGDSFFYYQAMQISSSDYRDNFSRLWKTKAYYLLRHFDDEAVRLILEIPEIRKKDFLVRFAEHTGVFLLKTDFESDSKDDFLPKEDEEILTQWKRNYLYAPPCTVLTKCENIFGRDPEVRFPDSYYRPDKDDDGQSYQTVTTENDTPAPAPQDQIKYETVSSSDQELKPVIHLNDIKRLKAETVSIGEGIIEYKLPVEHTRTRPGDPEPYHLYDHGPDSDLIIFCSNSFNVFGVSKDETTYIDIKPLMTPHFGTRAFYSFHDGLGNDHTWFLTPGVDKLALYSASDRTISFYDPEGEAHSDLMYEGKRCIWFPEYTNASFHFTCFDKQTHQLLSFNVPTMKDLEQHPEFRTAPIFLDFLKASNPLFFNNDFHIPDLYYDYIWNLGEDKLLYYCKNKKKDCYGVCQTDHNLEFKNFLPYYDLIYPVADYDGALWLFPRTKDGNITKLDPQSLLPEVSFNIFVKTVFAEDRNFVYFSMSDGNGIIRIAKTDNSVSKLSTENEIDNLVINEKYIWANTKDRLLRLDKKVIADQFVPVEDIAITNGYEEIIGQISNQYDCIGPGRDFERLQPYIEDYLKKGEAGKPDLNTLFDYLEKYYFKGLLYEQKESGFDLIARYSKLLSKNRIENIETRLWNIIGQFKLSQTEKRDYILRLISVLEKSNVFNKQQLAGIYDTFMFNGAIETIDWLAERYKHIVPGKEFDLLQPFIDDFLEKGEDGKADIEKIIDYLEETYYQLVFDEKKDADFDVIERYSLFLFKNNVDTARTRLWKMISQFNLDTVDGRKFILRSISILESQGQLNEEELEFIIICLMFNAAPDRALDYFDRLMEQFPENDYVEKLKENSDYAVLKKWAERYRGIDALDVSEPMKLFLKADLYKHDIHVEKDIPIYSWMKQDGRSVGEELKKARSILMDRFIEDYLEDANELAAFIDDFLFPGCSFESFCYLPDEVGTHFEEFQKIFGRSKYLLPARRRIADYYYESSWQYFGETDTDTVFDNALKRLHMAITLYENILYYDSKLPDETPPEEMINKAHNRIYELKRLWGMHNSLRREPNFVIHYACPHSCSKYVFNQFEPFFWRPCTYTVIDHDIPHYMNLDLSYYPPDQSASFYQWGR